MTDATAERTFAEYIELIRSNREHDRTRAAFKWCADEAQVFYDRLEALSADFEGRAKTYNERFDEYTKRKEHVIAAQQQGLAIAFKVAAKDLRTILGERK